MQTTALLRTLTELTGVSGDERAAGDAVRALLAPYGEVYTDALGSVVCTVNPGGARHILLDAHLDQVGLVVLEVTDEGFLRAAPCGGVDRRVLCHSDLTVHGREPLFAVVTGTPPHLAGDDADKVPETVLLDAGLSKERAAALVSPGDRVTLRPNFRALLGTCVSAPALDDRAGLCVLLLTLEALKSTDFSDRLTVVLSSLEETTEGGARTAAYRANADLCVAVDVTFAKTPDEKAEETGRLGDGPMIGYAPSLTRAVSLAFQKTAERCGLPYQTEVMGASSGTNADVMGVAGAGTRTGLLSVPLRYMHTGVEVVDTRDVENTARLLAEFLQREVQTVC
ncbi:MAG TPA: M42 family peptidase [Candidatus Fimenecus excrementigallinarum]|uniref:M42 family peptidase n=1 Tax=Candidatus Fimenecus excrementigallinarum TaxID=2840816 RepID=A0A9D1LEI0_9FIRM|nr:M42 family peptidase [Candidatus Fimenecus excrementigallinarum]